MPILVANVDHLVEATIAQVLRPPPPVDFEAWAVANVRFSERESAFTGPFNPKNFPFFAEMLQALGPDDPCRIVTIAKSAQIGGTVLANIFCLGSLAMDPGDFLYVHPTDDNARRWSRGKLTPMLMASPSIGAMFPGSSRSGKESILYKERTDGRGAIQISGANSPASLSQVSMKRQAQDDLSKWDNNDAGDPETQADSRSRAFEFGKILKISTPLVAPGCRITRNYEAGSQEIYLVPCPHCAHEQPLEWENFLANLNEKQPEKACFSCVECGCLIEEHHRADIVARGRWHAQAPENKRHHRSFQIWSAYAPTQSFELLAREWLKSKGDPETERVFMNDSVGRPWRAAEEAPPWKDLRERADNSTRPVGLIPDGFPIVTMGVDCQKDFVVWQIVAWSRDRRRAVIDWGRVDKHISDPECHAGLDRLLVGEIRTMTGSRIKPDMVAIDGNAWTTDVWEWARKHPASRVIMIRGVHSEHAPLIARVKKEHNDRGVPLKYSKRFYNFATSVLKLALYRNLMKQDPLERGHVALPKGLDDEYFRELTAETRKGTKNPRTGSIDYRWIKDPNQANEGLDTILQAEVAAIHYGVRQIGEERWDQLESDRFAPPAGGQGDLEDLLLGAARPLTAPAPAPVALAASPARESALDRLTRLNAST
jgi:phage terminase large subunit GpA-like protein